MSKQLSASDKAVMEARRKIDRILAELDAELKRGNSKCTPQATTPTT